MKSRILYPAILSALFMGMATGCHDDNGNYTYIDLDTVEIVTEDGGTIVLPIDRGDRVQLNPDIIFNGKAVTETDDVPLSYMWTLYSAGSGLGVDTNIDTICTTKAVDVAINRPSGGYILQLTVKNTDTGIESYYKATVNVSEAISGGWMMLYERADMPDYSDVGLVVNPFNKRNCIKLKEFWNIFSASNGAPLPGEPVNIYHQSQPMPAGSDRLATTKTLAIVHPADFSLVNDWDELFYEAPVADNVSYYGPTTISTISDALIIDNKLYHMTPGMNLGSTVAYFGIPKRYETDLGELAPWSAARCKGNTILECVVYSQTNGAFYYNTGTLDLHPFLPQDENSPFDINDMQGARLLFGDWGGEKSMIEFLLFAKGNSRYIGIANFSTSDCITQTHIAQSYVDVSSSPDITEAVTFATNPDAYFAYYSVGNKIYNVACLTGETIQVWATPDPDEVVTCVKLNKYYQAALSDLVPYNGSVVNIATWNESKKEGKLYQYEINTADGRIDLDGESYVYTVPGKVKAMNLKFEFNP